MLDIKIEKVKTPKVKPDYSALGFGKYFTDHMFLMNYSEDKGWHDARIVPYGPIPLDPSTMVFHYAQELFEGLKAYRTSDGNVQLFRPQCNVERMNNTCKRLCVPTIDPDDALQAIETIVEVDKDWVPYEYGTSLYIRPFMIGSGPQIGVAPAPSFLFRIFVMPVGAYYKGAVKPQKLVVSDWDRAAPHGTGDIKAGLNYAMSLHPTMDAHRAGYAENLYLDPQTRTYVEEAGGANVLFVDKDDNLIVPKSTSILPSITRRSLVYVAEHYLGLNVIERKVRFDEVKDMKECCLCGTAAVIAPVGLIHTHEGDIVLPSGMDKMGEISGRLRKTLTGIQDGEIEAPEGWIREVC